MSGEQARLGVDIGGTRVKLARVVGGRVQARALLRLPPDARSPAGLVEAIAKAARPLTEGAVSVGAGVAAVLDSGEGRVLASPNMPWLDGAPLAGLLGEALGLPAVIDNDVNCVGWGEAVAGAGRGAADQVCLALGTGLGGAVIRGGQLHRGRSGKAGELGHVVVRPGGPRCGCGGRGCAEQFASQTGLLRMARELGWRQPLAATDVPVIFEAAAEGDALARGMVQEAAEALGVLIAWCVELLRPERVVIAGGVGNAWPMLRQNAENTARKSLRRQLSLPPVVPATLAEDAGTIGAAMLGAPFGG